MAFRDKLKKIKNKLKNNKSILSLNYLSNEEKTGVVTGLVLLGAAAGYLFSSSEAEASTCVSGGNNTTTPAHNPVNKWKNWGRWCNWSKGMPSC